MYAGIRTKLFALFFQAKCLWRHPPGDEVYRKDNISFFEVDGEKSPVSYRILVLLEFIAVIIKIEYPLPESRKRSNLPPAANSIS